jgi:aromatic-L-amino-acid decarboxylase
MDLETHNTRILDAINASGAAFLSHTKLNGVYALRVAIGNHATTHEHVARAWDLLRRTAEKVST